jgi:acetyl esterase/lipase
MNKNKLSILGLTALMALGAALQASADIRPMRHVHLGGAFSHAPFTRTSLVLYPDIVYDENSGDTDATSLDLYTADPVSTNAPVVVYVHGGGFEVGDKAWSKDLDPKPEYFTNTLGHIFISINYRLLPEGRFPVNVQDVANALAWIHDNIADFGGAPGQIVLMGHSAGAHLVSQVATDGRYLANAGKDLTLLKGVIAIDGSSYDLAQSGQHESLLTTSYGPNWRDAAPIAHAAAGKGIPPFLLLHVTGSVGPRTNSDIQTNTMANALRQAGVRADVVALDDVEHFGANERIGEPGHASTAAVERFLSMFGPVKPLSTSE